MSNHGATNALLVLVAALLVANLAVPVLRTEEPAPPPPAASPVPPGLVNDLERMAEDLRVVVRLQRAPAAAPAGDEDALVVKIPGRLADEWELEAEDVRVVVQALAMAARRAGPSLQSARIAANETAAIATCRNISSAQAQFQATAKADRDNDGTGEFGCFVELSGAGDVRGDKRAGILNPPVLSGAFRTPSRQGFIARTGYHFLIYLPDEGGDGVAADARGFERLSDDSCETTWCMYAWPARYGSGSNRTFFVNQCGDVLATECPDYTGTRAPSPGAAFRDGGRHSITGIAAVGEKGQDGNVWRQVN